MCKANAEGQKYLSELFYGFHFLGKFFSRHQIPRMYLKKKPKKKKNKLWKQKQKVSFTNYISSFGMKVYTCPTVKLHLIK